MKIASNFGAMKYIKNETRTCITRSTPQMYTIRSAMARRKWTLLNGVCALFSQRLTGAPTPWNQKWLSGLLEAYVEAASGISRPAQ